MKQWNLTPVPVESDGQVEEMRVIRNSCRGFMTRNQDEISPEAQRRWWKTVERDQTLRAWLYRLEDHTADASGVVSFVNAGYGIVRIEGEKVLVSGGLRPECRGIGLGRALFAHLVAESGPVVHLEVLESNARARQVYERLGFREEARIAGIVHMVRRG